VNSGAVFLKKAIFHQKEQQHPVKNAGTTTTQKKEKPYVS
jgi:hypothetical protein